MNPFNKQNKHLKIHLKPIYDFVLADTETALSIYLKLAAKKNGSYLFESVVGGEKWGRYSIIGLGGEYQLRITDIRIDFFKNQELLEQKLFDNPLEILDFIKSFQQRFEVQKLPQLPVFSGGLVGYFGYETIRYIEKKLANRSVKPDTIGLPDCILTVSTDVAVVDNLKGILHLISHADATDKNMEALSKQRIQHWLEELKQPIEKSLLETPKLTAPKKVDCEFEMGEQNYKIAVNTIKKHIVAGDVMQTVPSHRMIYPFEYDPIHLYRALRHINPSPYMYFINYQDFQIVGASPEILVRLENSQAIVRPIAGTRHRGKTPSEDLALEKDLLSDKKELAEHLMLIDLGRNDIGRVCQAGSIKVTDKMVIERYSHVMHIVSNVIGQAKKNVHPIDMLKATFPAGTVTGAPKIRAMEIIDDIEPSKRGVYSGAVGYIGWHQAMDMAIAIRTAVIKNKHIFVQAGGGIVADSVDATEWQETLNKAKAIEKAITFVQQGRL